MDDYCTNLKGHCWQRFPYAEVNNGHPCCTCGTTFLREQHRPTRDSETDDQ